MKKEIKLFLKGSFFLLTIAVLILLLLNQYYVSFVQIKQQDMKNNAQWDSFQVHDNQLSYAFFGDSHVRDSLNTLVVNDSFNFAFAGEDYVETYYKFNYLYEVEKIDIDVVVLQVDLHTFSPYIAKERNLFDSVAYEKFISRKEIATYSSLSYTDMIFLFDFPVVGRGKNILLSFATDF